MTRARASEASVGGGEPTNERTNRRTNEHASCIAKIHKKAAIKKYNETMCLRELWYMDYGVDGTVSLLGVRQNLAGARTSGVERGGKEIERSAR